MLPDYVLIRAADIVSRVLFCVGVWIAVTSVDPIIAFPNNYARA